MNINFEYYKMFYIIAKNKNITKAADELNISQPAISRMLKTMEEQMNTKLFVRKNKGVILTNEGNELYRLIADNITNIMKSEIVFSKIVNNKTIKIAINKTFLNYLIKNNKFDNILKKNKNIHFINTNDFDLLNNQLSNNLIDFAFVSEPNNYKFNDEIKFKKIDELHLVFASNKKNDDNSNKSIVILDNNKFKEISNSYFQSINYKPFKTIIVDDYDNIYPLIFSGYANGFLVKEFINTKSNNDITPILYTPINNITLKIGLLYNINNEIKIKEYFDI